jgi:hypothetical protein
MEGTAEKVKESGKLTENRLHGRESRRRNEVADCENSINFDQSDRCNMEIYCVCLERDRQNLQIEFPYRK